MLPRFVIASLLLGLGISVQAQVRIQPELQELMTRATSTEPVTVIALFKNQMRIPFSVHRQNSKITNRALRENARLSQFATISRLRQMKNSGHSVEFRPLWLVNAVIVRISLTELPRLLTDTNIGEVILDQRLSLIYPYVHPGRPRIENKYTYGLEKIALPQVRQEFPELLGKGVRVGILDTGIDAKHPDLVGRTALFRDFVAKKTEPYDDNAHGTHVAGTIAGGTASGTAIGVAPQATLIVGKVFTGSGSGSLSTIMEGMQWLADPDNNPDTKDQPHLVSNSWGGMRPNANKNPSEEPLCAAVENWLKLNIVPVFSAGNGGPNPQTMSLPGGCPSSLSVGATDKNDIVAGFSSRGPAVWKSGSFILPVVSAPGVAVLSSVPGGGYKEFSGTSMAAPHVSGLVALLIQAAPDLSVEGIYRTMTEGTEDLGKTGHDTDYGAGRVNSYKTVKGALRNSRLYQR